LLAQPADVDVDRLALAAEVLAPDLLQQALARLHPARVGEQVGEEVELPRGETHLRLVQRHPAGGAVEREVAEGLALRSGPLGLASAPAEDRVDASSDLADREGLG